MHSQDDRRKLKTLHPGPRRVLEQIATTFPHDVLETDRTVWEQVRNVERKVSKTVESKHLYEYSTNPERGVDAVDVAPAPLRYPQRPKLLTRALLKVIWPWVKDLCRWYYFGGYVLGTADQMWMQGEIDTRLRWGGDWDSDREINDQTFDDLAHFERRA
jgi:hypothetical protein